MTPTIEEISHLQAK